MNCPAIPWYRTSAACLLIRSRDSVVALAILTIWSGANALAQNPGEQSNAIKPLSIRATPLLGFEGTPNNANGTLSIQNDSLQFQKDGKPAKQIRFMGSNLKATHNLAKNVAKTIKQSSLNAS